MKKKALIGALVLGIVLGATGCGSEADKVIENVDVSEYVTLGQYKGLTIELNDTTVTEDEVAAALKEDFEKEYSVTEWLEEGTTAEGDYVVIDYTGYVDGEPLENGSATDVEMEKGLGSNSFIDGFEKAIIGVPVGEEQTANLKFPDPYENNPDVAGKDVVFSITVKKIKKVTIPEMTDEFISEKSDYATVAEYTDAIRAKLVKEKEDSAESYKLSNAFMQIIKNSEIKGYPQDKVDEYKAEIDTYYQSYATQLNVEFEEFVKTYMNMESLDAYNVNMTEYAQSEVQPYLFGYAIAAAENITVTKGEYNEIVDNYENYGYETKQAMLDTFGGEDGIEFQLVWDKVLKFVEENNTFVPYGTLPATPTPEAEATPEADVTPDAGATPEADVTPDAEATPEA